MNDLLPGWVKNNLNKLCILGGGNSFKEEHQGKKSGDYPFIKVGDMNLPGNEKFITYSNNWLDIKTKNEVKPRLFPKGTIIFAKVGAALLLNRRRILRRETIIDNNLMGAIATDVDKVFLYYIFQNIDFSEFVQSGAIPSINQGQLELISVLVPPKPEQKKIATILTSVDTVIEKTEAQIEKLQLLKKAMIQELLTKGIGHTEFKDSPVGRIPNDWEIQKVGGIAEVIDPQPDHRTPPVVENGVPYIGMGDIGKNGDIDFDNARKVSQQAYDKQLGSFEIYENAFIFGKIGTIGNPSILPKKRFYCLSANIILITSKDVIIQNYLLQVFQSNIINLQIADQTNTTSQPALGIKKVRDFSVPVPNDLNELRKITSMLQSIDKTIVTGTDKLSKFSSIKKALMQDLLTGKVRVKVD